MLQVRNIFQLYADIEHTSRNNAFYEKYNLRYSMGELLRESHISAPRWCTVRLLLSTVKQRSRSCENYVRWRVQ